MNMHVLVVGGAGYVGGHTCKALAKAGFTPVVLDNLSTGHRDFVRWGPFIEADMRQERVVADAIRQWDCAAVLHFAACAYVGESILDPAKYYDNNVAGTLALLQGMRFAGCGKLIFSSTCASFGAPSEMPIRESTRPDPINPYGASKHMVERVLAGYGPAYGLKAVVLRYFNACGADEDGEIGELRDPETHLIPRAMMALLGHVQEFAVLGADYPTPDGTAIRDYIHVADLADAHVAGVSRLVAGQAGATFNLGTGCGFSVLEALRAIEDVTGETLPAVDGARRPGDPPILIADPSFARSELGFAAPRSDLRTIMRTAWAWHCRAHPRRIPTALQAPKAQRNGQKL